MTRDDFIAHLESYLDEYEGSTPLPEHVRMSVRGQLPQINQEPVWWPARRLSTMSSAMGIGVAVAAVLAIAVVALSFVAGERVGGPATEETTPSPTTPAMELPSRVVTVQPGRYSLRSTFPAEVTFEVPEGWQACVFSAFEQGVCAPTPDAGGVTLLAAENVVVDPCNTRLLEPPAGRSVEAFLSAVANLRGFSVTEPVDVRRGNVAGQQMIVTAPSDPQCQDLRTWSVPGRTNGVGPGEVNVVEVFDVGGRVVAITGAYRPGVLSADEIAEVRTIMESVEIRP
jgi:hypothetical protein